jgi:hypothetical protein
MKKLFKNKIVTVLVLLATLVLAGVAIFTAFRLYQLRQEAVAPTAPAESGAAACNEQCPGSDGVLKNCTPPDSDGTSQDSICNQAGRIESCGGQQFCCPQAGGTWTTDMSACGINSCTALSFTLTVEETPTPTPTSTPTTTATPTPTPTVTTTTTATPTTTTTTATATATPTLPESGIGTPTIFGIGIGALLLIVSLLLAL